MRTALTALLAFALLTAALSYKIGPAAHEATVDSADSPFQIKRAALKFESAFARLESILDELRPSVLQGRFSAAELRRLDNLLLQNQNYVKIALNHTLDAQKAADASKLRDEEGKAFPIQPNQNLQRVASAANSQSSQASELGKITSVLHKAGSGTAAKKPNTPQTTNRANPPAHPKPIATAKEHASAAKATPEPTQYTIQTSPKFLSPFKPGSKQNTSKPSPKLITKPAPKVRKAAKAHTAPPLLANYPAKSYQTPTKQVQGTKNPNGSSLSQKADSEFWEKGFKDVVQRRRTGRNNKPQVKRGPVLPPNFYKFNEADQLPAESRREDDEETHQQDQDQSSEQ